MTLIHPSSYVSPEAKIGNVVEVEPFSIIHANVILGNRVKVTTDPYPIRAWQEHNC
jgi:acyl-[acyl carrier protein]--UDP-N-acetylglucosamine O-acyltransferase